MTCSDCHGTRAVPDGVTGGYTPCPSCVIDAGTTYVVWESPTAPGLQRPHSPYQPDPTRGRASSCPKENAMSRESLTWLNTNTLIGCTSKRGHAWHWRAQDQGEQSNHYPGPIPLEDVQDRLFHWQAESRRLAVELTADVQTMTHLAEDGQPQRWAVVPDKQAICRSDDDTVLGVFGSGYARHQYREWLLTSVADLLDDDLAISSAGLLRCGAIAWVEVSMPDTITTPEGVAFRPNLLATTSFDGSIATTYKRTVTDTVCDNTRELALSEPGQEVKHSRNSHAQLGPARQALAMVHTLADDFAAEVARLCRVEVTHSQWEAFLDAHMPRHDNDGTALTGRSLTSATASGTPLLGSTGPTPGCRPGPVPPTASCRPSTPTSTTKESSGVNGPNATA